MIRQRHDVRLAFAEGWDENREHVQPVIKIVAELVFRDRFFQVLVRGGDQPDVDADGLHAPEALEFARLQHPEKLDLVMIFRVADFVQEEGAPFRQLESPLFPRLRPGKGAFFVAEEL